MEEFAPPAAPLTVKMIAESLFFRLSETRLMRPNRTNWAAISAASSLPMTDVKSHSHSKAVTAAKQFLLLTDALPAPFSATSINATPLDLSWYFWKASMVSTNSGG